MKQKFYYSLVVLHVVLASAWFKPAPLIAQEWSPAQKEVLEAIDEYTKISMQGDVNEIMDWFHADFQAWNYANGLPLDLDGTQRMIKYFATKFNQLTFDIQPVAIQLHEDIAIAHLYYQELMRDTLENETIMSGRWTATLVKQGDEWVFLCWTWAEDEI